MKIIERKEILKSHHLFHLTLIPHSFWTIVAILFILKIEQVWKNSENKNMNIAYPVFLIYSENGPQRTRPKIQKGLVASNGNGFHGQLRKVFPSLVDEHKYSFGCCFLIIIKYTQTLI